MNIKHEKHTTVYEVSANEARDLADGLSVLHDLDGIQVELRPVAPFKDFLTSATGIDANYYDFYKFTGDWGSTAVTIENSGTWTAFSNRSPMAIIEALWEKAGRPRSL